MFTTNQKKQAVIEVVLFIIIVYGLNYTLLNWNQNYSLPSNVRGFFLTWGVLLQMWIPGITSIIFRLIFRSGFEDIGWKIGNRKFWRLAILIPISVPPISYIIAFFMGNASLTLTAFQNFIYRDPIHLFTLNWPTWFPRSPWEDLLIRSIVVLTVGLTINFVLAFGEELGWRGYLQQRIIGTQFKYPYALCGLIWAGWHYPFLWYLYNPTSTQIYESVFFTINVIFLGMILGRLRTNSGSVWIPAMLHAAHNTIHFELFAAVISCNHCELYVGENGIIMGMIYGVISILIFKTAGRCCLES